MNLSIKKQKETPMKKLKKHKKLWIYALLLGAIVIGGAIWAICCSSGASPWKMFSKCGFDPSISKKNKALIDETFSTVADDGLFTLLGKKSRLEEIGAIIGKEVPDLVYWAYVLSTPKLKKEMKTIQTSSPKYNGFIEATQKRIMKEYHENSCLLKQAAEFAKYVHLPEEKTVAVLKDCIDNDSKDSHGFKKFLDYLFQDPVQNLPTKTAQAK